MSRAGTIVWFARHEVRLAWRDWLWLMSGRRRSGRKVALGVITIALLMHGFAYLVLYRKTDLSGPPDKRMLVLLTGMIALYGSLMLSQAIEGVTRAFYGRGDLDLILSSPVAAWRLFAVRIGAIAVTVAMMSLVLAAPFINVASLVWRIALARCLRRYRGAGDGRSHDRRAPHCRAVPYHRAQAHALLRADNRRRDRRELRHWRAIRGNPRLRHPVPAGLSAIGGIDQIRPGWRAACCGGRRAPCQAIWLRWQSSWPSVRSCWLPPFVSSAPRFGSLALATGGVSQTPTRQGRRSGHFRRTWPSNALRRKEWTLLRRDPWLMSQILMQLLYLLPPAFLLWRAFYDRSGASPLLVTIIIIAAGQLAGSLAWLAISGEDAPDLIASAPVTNTGVFRAKTEAVMGVIAIVFGPFVVALAGRCPDFRPRHCDWGSSPPPLRPPQFSSGFAPKPSAATSGAAKLRRVLPPLPKRFRRSTGAAPAHWRPRALGSLSSPASLHSQFSPAHG